MTLQTDRLSAALAGRYRIQRHLGQGGMATVFLAEDLKHERNVAIKVLKPELAAVLGAERFVQEIKTTAALSHPHILPLFDSGTADGFLFYVMPFIEGETIREKLNRESQFSVEEAVRITREVADALDYAHRRGIIHRDIKPENVILHDGRAMVMDFGIALALSAAAGGRMTETGLSLGTPHYMSPEQATADKDLSPRSDVYSLASVLYEMLSGQPPHLGASAQQIIMRIIADTPRPVTELRKSVPPNVGAAVAKALEKLPADRFSSAKEFSDALALQTFTHLATSASAVRTTSASTSRTALLAIAALMIFAIGAVGWTVFRPATASPVMRYDITIGPAPLEGHDVVISPDGTMLAYGGNIGNNSTAIFVRRLDGDPDFHQLEGTESGSTPSFSPDSKWIVFRRERDASLAKISVAGGGQTTLVTDPLGFNPHWGTQTQILYSGPNGMYIVSPDGGKPLQVESHGGIGRRPFLLPDGSGILGSLGQSVVLYDLKSDSVVELVQNGHHPVYVTTGHIAYVDDQGGVSVVPFDLSKHRVTGSPVRVLDRVAGSVSKRGFSISNNGTVIQHEGARTGTGNGNTRFVMRSLDGKSSDTLPLEGFRRTQPRFSPNGKLLAYTGGSGATPGTLGNIFVYDLASGTNTQLTFDGNTYQPVWSPDGTRILYSQDSAGGRGGMMHIKRADNSGTDQIIPRLPDETTVGAAWPSDSLIVYESFKVSGMDIVTLVLGSNRRQPYSQNASNEVAISPDGRLAAYGSTQAGARAPDVWISEFPTPASKFKVTPTSGVTPRWSADGKYLYFRKQGARDTLFRVEVTRTPTLTVHAPTVVGEFRVPAGRNPYDVHPDGKRYILAVGDPRLPRDTAVTQPAPRHVLITNWFAEVNALTKKASK